MNRSAPFTRRSAFSVVEVLVAAAVLAIVMTILLGTLTTSLSLWRNTEGKLASDREGRAAELLLAQDLASVIVPASSNLWPQTNAGRLSFLLSKPVAYQREGDDNVGDVCYVQYSLSSDGTALLRNFLASRETYDRILANPAAGLPDLPLETAQVLATNILPTGRDAVRGLEVYGELGERETFYLLDGDLLPRDSGDTNPPTAVEVSFGVTDPDGIANQDLLADPGHILRNAGYYSFRISLPQPSP